MHKLVTCPHWLFGQSDQFLFQALIVTHFGADPNDAGTYLAEKLLPLQPLVCIARTTALPPGCDRSTTVRSWWEDGSTH